jgi:hypothetical protein
MVLRRFSSGNVSKGIALFGSVVIAAALAFFGYIGTFSRFWADDYCYSALINQYGWLNGIKMYYLTSGNRFSTIATVGLIDLLGPRVISFLPVSLLAFWVIAWYVFLNGVRRLLSWKVERAWLLWIPSCKYTLSPCSLRIACRSFTGAWATCTILFRCLFSFSSWD